MRKQFLQRIVFGMALLLCFNVLSFGMENSSTRDTISMEPGRTHDAYYSLSTGETAQVIRDNWDIAFSTRQMDVTIRTNGANGIKLFTYPNSDISGWETMDTTGLSTWTLMYDDDTDWENGAFNLNASGHPDYGWGTYSMTTHFITGDSLFVLQMPDNKCKKIWIVQKNPISNEYTFKYANMDGSDEMEVVFAGNDYADKNFVGYSFSTNEFVDREPNSADWDLVFTKYMTFYMGIMWYGVTGVQQNYNVQVASYPETDTSFVDFSVQALDSANISTIGYNWWSMEGGSTPSFKITDSLVYFVSDKESSIWKLVFEYYESSLGEIGFKKQLFEDHAGITEIQTGQSGNLAIQPNPANGDFMSVLFDADKAGNGNLAIYNMSGAKIIDQEINYHFGLNNHQVHISDIPTGVYVVMMNSGNVTLKNKLIVQ